VGGAGFRRAVIFSFLKPTRQRGSDRASPQRHLSACIVVDDDDIVVEVRSEGNVSGEADFCTEGPAGSLGDEGTDALVDVLNRQREQMTDAIIRAIVKAILRELEPRFGAIGARLTAIDERFGAIDQHFAAIDRRFAAIEGRFAAIDGRLAAIDGRFAAIESKLSRVMVLQAVTLLAVIGATVRMLLA